MLRVTSFLKPALDDLRVFFAQSRHADTVSQRRGCVGGPFREMRVDAIFRQRVQEGIDEFPRQRRLDDRQPIVRRVPECCCELQSRWSRRWSIVDRPDESEPCVVRSRSINALRRTAHVSRQRHTGCPALVDSGHTRGLAERATRHLRRRAMRRGAGAQRGSRLRVERA